MERETENKIVLVVRETRYDELLQRFNTEAQARFYIEHLGADFAEYQREHQVYHRAISDTERTLAKLGRVQRIVRRYLPNFVFGERDLVVVLGPDGLVANTLKYLSGQPVLGVNPDPSRWEGVLLPFTVGALEKVVRDCFAGRRGFQEITMAKAALNNGQVLEAVNDLFIGQRTHVSARYILASGGKKEQHSSSGIIVSTGLGSTGWFRSVMTGAARIAEAMGGAEPEKIPSFPWNSSHLFFSVREPWPSKQSQASLVFGKVTSSSPLTIISQMSENGVIFSDGMERDYLEFNSGALATVSVSERQGLLVV